MAMVIKSLRPEIETMVIVGLSNAVGMLGYCFIVVFQRVQENIKLERELKNVPTIAELKAEAKFAQQQVSKRRVHLSRSVHLSNLGT